jgi:SAM-dependent methyltransferase
MGRIRRDFIDFRRRHFRRISRAMSARAVVYGAEYGVSPAIHRDDFMFWTLHDDLNRKDKLGAVQAYFASGYDTALRLKALLDGHLPPGPLDLLDFAAGYARVTRHFARVWPEARPVLCDIHEEAVAFARGIGFEATPSTWTPEEFSPGTYDAIVTVSFFTHMPREVWTRWLVALGRALRPGGVLLFTTHGAAALDSMGVRDVAADGFKFIRTSEQKDLAVDLYGATVALPAFVRAAVEDAGLQIAASHEAGLGLQDVYIVRRS